jgi:hypothetical protein
VLRFYNGPTDAKLYDMVGRLLGTFDNYDNDVSLSLLGGGNYIVQYTSTCGFTNAEQIFYGGNAPLGKEVISPFLYAPTGQEICNSNNELIFLLYYVSGTTISNGAPLVVGSQLYQAGPRGSFIGVYRAGSYLLPNGNKYNVNASGVVVSIEVGACNSSPEVTQNAINNRFKNIRKNIYDIDSKNQTLYKVKLTSVQTINVNGCYKFVSTNGQWVSGKVTKITPTGEFLEYDITIEQITCGQN